jgi:hypothetical protein
MLFLPDTISYSSQLHALPLPQTMPRRLHSFLAPGWLTVISWNSEGPIRQSFRPFGGNNIESSTSVHADCLSFRTKPW